MQTIEEQPTQEQQQKPKTSNGPEAQFTAGAVSATVWKNESTSREGQPVNYHTVSLQRRYKDKDGQWKTSSSLRVNDLPKATLVLSKAYEHIVLRDEGSS